MALEHITVLDLTHMLSGPYGTMLLADLGARTIKVEPLEGEFTRGIMKDDPQHARDGMGPYFLTLNRNKESVCLDLKSDGGKAVFMDLVRRADVVFNNFSAGVPARLGISHEDLARVNPRIVTCSVTGFGETGPETQRPAFDQVVQGMGGGMSITGTEASGPTRSGIPIGDLCGGLFGAMGVLAALAERERTGLGQHVDVSMLDAQVSLLNYMATMHLLSGEVPTGIGNGHFVHVPYNSYQTTDGHVIVACIGDTFFERFVEAVDLPELRDPALRLQPARLAAKERIDALVGKAFRERDTAHWLQRLRAARIPCGPVNNFAEALADAQVQARDMVVPVRLKTGDVVRMPGNPIKLSSNAQSPYSCPPALGENTDEVLTQWLGYPADKLAQLRQAGAVA